MNGTFESETKGGATLRLLIRENEVDIQSDVNNIGRRLASCLSPKQVV